MIKNNGFEYFKNYLYSRNFNKNYLKETVLIMLQEKLTEHETLNIYIFQIIFI